MRALILVARFTQSNYSQELSENKKILPMAHTGSYTPEERSSLTSKSSAIEKIQLHQLWKILEHRDVT